MDYTIGIKHPYRRHCYVLQNVLIMQAIQVTLYTMENSSPFMGSSPNSGQTQDHCVCRSVGCNTFPEVCKLNTAHHLLSLSVLWQYCNSQVSFQFLVIPYPPFSTMNSSRYPVLSTVLKLWITIMQLQKTFPSFGRKLKGTWFHFMSAALHCFDFIISKIYTFRFS